MRRLLSGLFLSTLLFSCTAAPKAPTVKEPFYSWQKLTQYRMTQQLSRAASAWDTLKNPRSSKQERLAATAQYEQALATTLKEWNRSQLPRTWESGSLFQHREQSFRIDLQPAPGHPQEISPLMLDRLLIAQNIRVKGRRTHVQEKGFGVPVVGQVIRSEKIAAKYPMVPPNGAHLTLTAVLDFGPQPQEASEPRICRLHLYNPLRQPEAPAAGSTRKLAADYTAPKELALNDGFLKRFSLIGLLYPERVLDQSQLYRLELYDPQRIPVVFVHGLMSDPHIWYDAINAIYADPVLRANYQPWYFLYPTGMAVPATSKRLRDSLTEAREKLDPEGDDPGMNQMVLVGHSMGGLLNRMQTIDSGDTIWKAYFNCEPEKLNLSRPTRERLVSSLRFEKQPNVKRLIFIAVPQRGSQVADKNFVYRVCTSLIRLPLDSVILSKEILSGNLDALSPQIRDWGIFAFLSVGTLSPKHPYLKALNSQPIPVPHHSIVGRVGKGPLELSSDRVVPYSSAHLPTGTELVVPYWHGCVEKPEVVAEVAKRLKQHLREIGRL